MTRIQKQKFSINMEENLLVLANYWALMMAIPI